METDEGGGNREKAPHTNVNISDFAKRTRELGHRLERLERDRGREPIRPEDRPPMREWIEEARSHTLDPQAFDIEALADDHTLDYIELASLYRQLSELVRDRD